jgi:hypothetical protein
MTDRCEISRCRDEAAITYLDHGVCEKHWNHLTAEDAPPDALRISLGIEATAPAATEETTMEPATEKTAKKSKKPPAKPKAAKGPKPAKVNAPKEPLVVFAFRLSEADRDAIHKAAGPGKATKFVLAAALAAAKEALTSK